MDKTSEQRDAVRLLDQAVRALMLADDPTLDLDAMADIETTTLVGLTHPDGQSQLLTFSSCKSYHSGLGLLSMAHRAYQEKPTDG